MRWRVEDVRVRARLWCGAVLVVACGAVAPSVLAQDDEERKAEQGEAPPGERGPEARPSAEGEEHVAGASDADREAGTSEAQDEGDGGTGTTPSREQEGAAEGSGEASSEEGGAPADLSREAAAPGAEETGEAASRRAGPSRPLGDDAQAEADGVSKGGEASGRKGAEHTEAEEGARSERPLRITGEYRLRFNFLGDVPLFTIARTGYPDRLGQNWWIDQWLRLGGSLSWGGTLKLVAELDLAHGMVAGEEAQGVSAAARPRDADPLFPRGVVEPRQFYLQWLSPVGQLRVGLQTSHWGLGILANDGAHEQPFGDYRFGDRVFRLLFATKPLGRASDFYVALLGDVVYDDLIATWSEGERALQGTVAAFYRKGEGREERTVGFYGVYRDQRRDALDRGRSLGFDERLRVGVADVYARWTWDEPSGGTLFAAFEGAYVFGETNLTRTSERDVFAVRQFIAAGQFGRLGDTWDVVLEAGYASGDSNAEDDVQRRGSMDPDHRVGLVLFPELMAAQTARAATLARSEELFARPQPGTDLLPTDGGVAGAWYLFPYASWRPMPWLDARLGAVWARASAPVTDPFRQRAYSRSVNFQGGDPNQRDLGLEVDGALLARFKLQHGIVASGGVEGGVLFPGRAFDDAAGGAMGPLGMVRLRAGLRF